jgi:hypothetical protein
MANVSVWNASTDIALTQVMFLALDEFGVKYVLEGHSFIEEGISTLSKNYGDGKYISSSYKQFGK